MKELGFGFAYLPGIRDVWWLEEAVFAADFANDRYMRLGASISRVEALGFARASGGYARRQDGVFAWFAAGEPRIVPGAGVLIEPAATNLLIRADDLSAGAWSPSNSIGVVTHAAAAPAIGQGADRIVANTNNAPHILQQVQSFASGETYTLSAVLKADGYGFARLALPSTAFPGDGRAASFNLATGVIGQVQSGVTAHMEPLADGFHRCSVTVIATATTTGNIAINIQPSDSATTLNFAGDGSSGLLVWCPQCELGPVATSPIVSSASAATRAADALTLSLPEGEMDLTVSFSNEEWQTITGASGAFGISTGLDHPVVASIHAVA